MQLRKEILNWYIEAGVTETVAEVAINRFSPVSEQILLKKEIPAPISAAQPVQETVMPENTLLQSASQLAAAANNLEELKNALMAFDGCALKKNG